MEIPRGAVRLCLALVLVGSVNWSGPIPTAVAQATLIATDVAAGSDHTCAVTTAGTVMCWGSNGSGQLGNNSTTASGTPVQVSSLSNVTAVFAGGHSCARAASGGASCWGANTYGQLGDNSTTQRNTPVSVRDLSGVKSLAVGGQHTCALLTTGVVRCWGFNQSGQLGTRNTTSSAVPVTVSGLTGVVSIAAGENHTCAVTGAGTVWCWGSNVWGQLGDGTSTNRSQPTQVSGLSGIASVAAGPENTCVLSRGGGVKCWGTNSYGQLGDGTTNNANRPVQVRDLTIGVASVAVGRYHVCVRMSNASAKCWGMSGYGQLGNGGNSLTGSRSPVNVLGLTSGVVSVSAGWFHACAATVAGKVLCWGANGYGGGWGGSTPIEVGTLGPTPITLPTVIILPGIMGTRLQNASKCGRGNTEVWPNLEAFRDVSRLAAFNESLATLRLATDGATAYDAACDQISPTTLFYDSSALPVMVHDYYGDIVGYLAQANYPVREFPYDWRLDLNSTVTRLDQYIQGLNQPQVILVGHSMGGLLARAYVADNGRAARVRAVITVGTPYWGAPKMAVAMRDGSNPFPLPLSWVPDPVRIRDVIRNSPGAMQLLPSQAYFAEVRSSGYFQGPDQAAPFGSLEATHAFYKGNDQSSSLLDRAVQFHAALDSIPESLPGTLTYYALRATNRITPGLIRETRCVTSRTGHCLSVDSIEMGDGTVPWLSAGLGSTGQRSGAAQVCTYRLNTVLAEHGELLSDDFVMADIVKLLNAIVYGSTPNTFCLPEGTPLALGLDAGLTTGQVVGDHAFGITLWGEARPWLVGPDGLASGVDATGAITDALPNVTFELLSGGARFLLPGGEVYTLTLTSSAGEPVQLQITDYQTQDDSGSSPAQSRATFLDLTLDPQASAELPLDLTGGLPPLVLSIFDANGQPMIAQAPDHVLDAAGLADGLAPTTQVDLQGTHDAWGFFTGPVTVTLTAEDAGVGVARTYISRDQGAHWETYSAPLGVSAETVPVLMAYSLDQNANAEVPHVLRLHGYGVWLPNLSR